ncbi:MAG: tetratricopeptide repeat protein [Chloroflexota bacterium]|nr:tetratricopeptide repeat protein [Chloroflexota bacterium]
MQIHRDYSEPFFARSGGRRRRGRNRLRLIVVFFLLIGGFLFYVDSNFYQLRIVALDAIGQAPPPTPFSSQYATWGMDAFMIGNVAEAERQFAQAVAQQPNNIDYLYEYGRVLLERAVDDDQYYARAIEVGDRAITADPNDVRGYALKTLALSFNDDAASAVPVGQAGLQVDRFFAPLHAALSDAYRRIDRYDVALETAEEAIRIDPLDPLSRRVYAYALIWVGDRESAVEQLEQAVALNRNITGPYFELANMYRAQDELELAVATYEQILALQPENARAYQRMCETYFQASENTRAQVYCEEALAIQPDYALAWASLGQTQYSRRNYEGAIESFQNCVQFGGDDSDIRCYYLRGLAHYYLGDCDEAWNILNDAVRRIQFEFGGSEDNPVLGASLEGIRLVTVSCNGYGGRSLPTRIPPTPIPPTPIGG